MTFYQDFVFCCHCFRCLCHKYLCLSAFWWGLCGSTSHKNFKNLGIKLWENHKNTGSVFGFIGCFSPILGSAFTAGKYCSRAYLHLRYRVAVKFKKTGRKFTVLIVSKMKTNHQWLLKAKFLGNCLWDWLLS